jgi:branched-chain amino acid transport system ATP-binding protein
LQKNKEKRINRLPAANPKSYEIAYRSINGRYTDCERKLNAKYSAIVDKKEQKLERKLTKINRELERLSRQSGRADSLLPDDVILSVRGLKMYFGGLRAVDDLDFDVKRGEIFGLIGPNGAGKTTVFNCITQFYKPTAGELLFAPAKNELITLTDYKVHDIVLKGIARTFQNIEVVKEVSVLENLLIAATRKYNSNLFEQMLHLPILKREEKYMRAKADKVLKYMDLYSYRDRLAWGLPYGVLKRIEIARALMCNPKLIILDEPAAGLNESETHELAELINKIRKDFGCTILLVEHDMSLVMNICDHICAISFGKKLAYGTAEEVQSSKEVQEAYLGVGGN